MVDSIFTKIIKGELPCYKTYEDDKTVAFLTTEPFMPGHTLVVPKVQVENFDNLDLVDYEAVFGAVRVVTKRLKAVFGVEKVAVMITGFHVPHVHVHLIPVTDKGEFSAAVQAHFSKQALLPYVPSGDELARIAKKINRGR